jgi:hypothetical protein
MKRINQLNLSNKYVACKAKNQVIFIIIRNLIINTTLYFF